MAFTAISKFLLVLILPFLLFLAVFHFAAFGLAFYEEKFKEYGVYSEIPQADSLNAKVISFIIEKNDKVPNEFNEREKQHLRGVRRIIGISRIMLYVSVFMFLTLIAVSSFMLKEKKDIINFAGDVFIFGGVFTIILAAALFFFINSDFSNAFESFHQILFENGTYTFDPSKEIIVRLYPEQLFMDMGIKIAKGALMMSVISILSGMFLLFNPKNKKNKKH